ncbi:MAG TPA: PEP-CTERM sorting domain-containing protein [Candidatus Limnocylindrales bacterium]|nr:PEP-CTERM sorting domain-containing protein [Candidatus Limnocylindrales bacterium]
MKYALLLCLLPFVGAADNILYSTLPGAIPPNVPSEAFEATSTSELGALIGASTGSGPHHLIDATVLMSDWAKQSNWVGVGTTVNGAPGYYVPLTLNLYQVAAMDAVGSLIASVTTNAFAPFRPEMTATCPDDSWRSGTACYHGIAFTVSFDLTGITVPGEFIYGLALDTTDYGYHPTGVAGPYDSLNFGVTSDPPSVGSNPQPDNEYRNTTWSAEYADAGAGGLGTFRNTGFTGENPIISFEETPEPGTLALFGGALIAVGLFRRKR